ncbi:MAG: hypothetical protein J6A04_00195 [Clostridia bacterium]|nr:hypothetical protein [Clostridia bacterium]
MQRELKKEWFEKYFFYGLENKDEVLKWIIAGGTKMLADTHRKMGFETRKDGYELDKQSILELIVQLERFTSLHDDPKHRKYFYDSINIDSISVNKMFNQKISETEKNGAISCVKYEDFSGIFFTTHGYSDEVQEKYHLYSGEQYLNQLNQKSAWAGEVFNVLCYLNELEKENRFEYYSLFLDSKYARAIDRNKKGITDDREIHEIRNVYRKFLRARQISGIDIKLAIKGPMSKEMKEYIEEHYPEYDTITTLKTDAINDRYKHRLETEVNQICNMFLKEKNQGIEI